MAKQRFIVNPKNEKGIIAEIIGKNMLRIIKRRSDHNPISVIIKGNDYDVVTNCTLTGDPIYIDCVNGQIVEKDLKIIEKEHEDGKENKNDGPTGPAA